MSKAKQNLALAGGSIGFLALLLFLEIATYGDNKIDAKALAQLRFYEIPEAESQYIKAQERAVGAGLDTLKTDIEYNKMQFNLRNLADSMNHASTYEKFVAIQKEYEKQFTESRIRAEKLFNECIDNDSALIAASKQMQERRQLLEKMQRDSVIASQKNAQKTFKQKMSDNFDSVKKILQGKLTKSALKMREILVNKKNKRAFFLINILPPVTFTHRFYPPFFYI